MSVITVERKILKKNDEIAAENRQMFTDNQIYVINSVRKWQKAVLVKNNKFNY